MREAVEFVALFPLAGKRLRNRTIHASMRLLVTLTEEAVRCRR
jgi:hypothetical protein